MRTASIRIAALALAGLAASRSLPQRDYSNPIVTVKNGTYQGVHSTSYGQDFFLGIPYAQPPVGSLRFVNPQSYNETWADTRQATEYSPECVGCGPSQIGYNVSEDCLYLNIIRPSNVYSTEPLPVLVWIHGGGFVQGGGTDLRYNMSFIIQRSVEIGKPIMAITINYRLSAWGFLSSEEVTASGNTNMGIRDQRLALNWINENIAAFGGNCSKVTIWGQSAGAASVGVHLLAYNGRHDGLFRSAIMDSGGPIAIGAESASLQSAYDQLVNATGCTSSSDSLDCLRSLSFENLNKVINTTGLSGAWSPRIDGDIVARHSSQQVADGNFVKVPIIIGTNTDEGTSFGPKGINTTEQFHQNLLTSPVPEGFSDEVLAAYPFNSTENILPNLGGPDYVPPAYPYGLQYRRTSTYYGDKTFIASRRLSCETWSKFGLDAYCYRFNAIPAWAGPFDGATHFVEVAFAMLNLNGVGYEPIRTPPFQGLGEEFRDLAHLMSSDYIAFTVSSDPNSWEGRSAAAPTMGQEVPSWPKYEVSSNCTGAVLPKSFLYDANVTSSVENDTYRKEAIDLLNSANLDVFDR